MPYAMSPACSFMMTGPVAVAEAVGRTQASSVIPVVRSSEFESGTLTKAFVPLKESALPYLPAAAPAHVAFASVPLLPLPDWSVTVVPLPVSKP